MNDSNEIPADEPNAELLADFQALWAEAEALWCEYQETPAFRGYVSADYPAILECLWKLRGQVSTFLEWGSGLGVVAIMASRLGFEACGIENEPILVEHARTLAEKYDSRASFGLGTFIPDDFDWNPSEGDQTDGTVLGDPSGYEELDMDLVDFDLVYAYPWPDELTLFKNIMRSCGAPHSLFLSYDAREGTALVKIRRK
jgi:hypothetical protein